MPKYPLWKYLIIVIAIAMAILYAIPNIYGEQPAIQISASATSNNNGVAAIDESLVVRVNTALKDAQIIPTGISFNETHSRLNLRFANTDLQLSAQTLISKLLGDNYIVALNLLPNSPTWLRRINSNPMFLGLDLRGGVHFLLEVDTKQASKKALAKDANEIKHELQNLHIRYGQVAINDSNETLMVELRDHDAVLEAIKGLKHASPELDLTANNNYLELTMTAGAIKQLEQAALKQNILTLHNRVNELGVSEPIIQQQGLNRIVVELPGIQDTARAKSILGRTASLEVRLVNDDSNDLANALAGNVPANYELLASSIDGAGNSNGSNNNNDANSVVDSNNNTHDADTNSSKATLLVSKDVELTGDNINDANAGFDENGKPAVNIRLDSTGATIFRDLTQANVGKRLAMVLVDNGKSQVVTAPVIRGVIGGGQVQISGAMNVNQANDVALLLRSGSLAAPMNIIEERTIGPSLGHDNIILGIHAVLIGFAAVALFMMVYYSLFGIIAITSLAINLLLLVAVLSMLQATLTLPGIAAIALTLGMAIDANVLINERIREELRNSARPLQAIDAGYKHAFATIIDSNVTTLIAGLALLAFGSGPVKGFAIVHCIGILTSMFSAVLVSRGIVALIYAKGRLHKKLYI